MRRYPRTFVSLFGLALAAGCAGGAPSAEGVGNVRQPIQGGVLDPTDDGVIGILVGEPNDTMRSICTGTLIAPNLVLTARHCVSEATDVATCGTKFGTLRAASRFALTSSHAAFDARWSGASDRMPARDGATWFAASRVVLPGTDDWCGYDVALLQLADNMTSVCPIIPRIDQDVVAAESLTAVGFGSTSPSGGTGGTKRKLPGLSVSCQTDCRPKYEVDKLEYEATATPTNAGTCTGDSGGPALDAKGRVVGVASRGPSDACNPTIYESIFAHAPWLRQVAGAAATEGGYVLAPWANGVATDDPSSGGCPTAAATDAGTATTDGGTSPETGPAASDAPLTDPVDGGCALGPVGHDAAQNAALLAAGVLAALSRRRTRRRA